MAHQNLAVAVRSRADADGWNVQLLCDARGQVARNHLQHHRERTRRLKRLGVGLQVRDLVRRLAAFSVAAHLMDRLREQPEMSHHGNADIDEPLHHVDNRAAALELHRRRTAFLHQPAGVAQRFGGSNLICQKRHIGDDERGLSAATDRRGVMHHHVDSHRDGAVVSQHRHADRIAHE